jgi:hypothetical protein
MMTNFPPLQRLLVLLLSLLWATMGSAAALAECGDFGHSSIAANSAPSFFEDATYTPKVLQQASRGAGEFHSFSASVDAFESAGTIRTITGGDKVVRQVLEIPGSYMTPSSAGVPGRLYGWCLPVYQEP